MFQLHEPAPARAAKTTPNRRVQVASRRASHGSDWSGHLALVTGYRHINWDRFEDLVEVGLTSDLRPARWPISLIFNVSYAESSGKDLSGNRYEKGMFAEIDLGTRFTFDLPRNAIVKPFVGGGLAVVQTRHKIVQRDALWFSRDNNTISSTDDWGLGLWLQAGLNINVDNTWFLGADIKYTLFDAQPAGFEIGNQTYRLGLTMGASF